MELRPAQRRRTRKMLTVKRKKLPAKTWSEIGNQKRPLRSKMQCTSGNKFPDASTSLQTKLGLSSNAAERCQPATTGFRQRQLSFLRPAMFASDKCHTCMNVEGKRQPFDNLSQLERIMMKCTSSEAHACLIGNAPWNIMQCSCFWLQMTNAVERRCNVSSC